VTHTPIPTPGPADLPARVQEYVAALVDATRGGPPLASLVLFGSAVRGGFSQEVSDVDLIVVLDDTATAQDRERVLREVERLEVAHGFRAPEVRRRSALEVFIDRAGGNALSCFVCTRADLLSGEVARVFGLRPAEAVFVDRIVFANVIVSAATVWGEDLLPRVPIPPIRRLDVIKALFAFHNQLTLVLVSFAVLPNATRHAMGALKRSLHSCYFCYHLRTASLEEEVAFFRERPGGARALDELLELRGRYRESLGFVLRAIPTVLGMHRRAALENRFPREVSRRG
jgi:predicted nucleotidyltransferase